MEKILIIEDDPLIQENIQEVLQLENFHTILASDGAEGLDLATSLLPDLILCDVTLPEIDGYGVLQQLRQNASTETIPFIFLTARADKPDVRHGMELGADDYLAKPCKPDELRKSIVTRLNKQATVEQKSQRRLDELRDAITRSLPHELHTPLNGIIGIAQLLREYDAPTSDPEVREMLGLIETSGQRLYELIQKFLQYADLELISTNPEQIAAIRSSSARCFARNLVIDVARQKAQHMQRETDLQLDLEPQDSLIKISEGHLFKVATEIIDNAFKFSATGTAVRVMSHVRDAQYHLYIVNQGRGMTSEQIRSIGAYMQFERGFHEQQGSGLGLSIAKRIADLQGGELAIESFPGEQTIVHVTLPCD